MAGRRRSRRGDCHRAGRSARPDRRAARDRRARCPRRRGHRPRRRRVAGEESDRITALVAGFRALGIDADERDDGFVVRGRSGKRPTGGVADARGDHRMAMAVRRSRRSPPKGRRPSTAPRPSTSPIRASSKRSSASSREGELSGRRRRRRKRDSATETQRHREARSRVERKDVSIRRAPRRAAPAGRRDDRRK